HPRGARAFLGLDEVLDTLALDRLAVDMEHAVDHLDAIAGQADHALDVVSGIVLRQPEHDHVAAGGLRRPDASGEQRRGGPRSIVAVTRGKFRTQKKIAHEPRRPPPTPWNGVKLD